RWLHWGAPTVAREDYPVHDVVLMWQNLILSMLLDPATLSRIRDGEMRIAVDADAFTTAELLDRLTKAILTEIQQTGPGDYTARKPAIASLRRALQRAYVARLAGLAMESVPSLPDAQALAAMHLRSTAESIDSLLAKQEVKLDDVSRAHLIELGDRIDAVLDADLQLPRP
ncbi:MAG: zinc-dependent metalloprotease, partial [Planctomycetia bacterium]